MGHAFAPVTQDREEPRSYIGGATMPARPISYGPVRHTQIPGKWRLPPGAVKRLSHLPQYNIVVPHFPGCRKGLEIRQAT